MKGDTIMINVYIRPAALSDVCGRVDYISSSERQENLVATYSEVDIQFWKELSEHCRKQAEEAGHKKACEGREWHGALPNELAEKYKGREEELARKISKIFKELTGTENIVGIHWNKKMTNFHFHAVCSENKEINKITYGAVLTRNTYYNAAGKRSTKKECLDPEGNLLSGCKFYPKGSCIESVQRFGSKEYLRDYKLNKAIKKAFAEAFNQELHEKRYKVYENDGIHLKTQKVGNYIPEEIKKEIEAKNEAVRAFNSALDEMLQATEEYHPEALQKTLESAKSIRQDIKKYKMSEHWIKSINFYLQRLKKHLNKIKEKAEKAIQERSEAPQKAFSSLDDRLRHINAERVEKAKIEPTHLTSFGDEFDTQR